MARIRTIKPDLWEDESIGLVSRDARLLFIGLITQADDSGRLRGDLRLLRAKVFPYDESLTTSDIECWLDELTRAGLVVIYDAGFRCIALPSWKHNQKINRPFPSRLPAPPRDHSLNDHEPFTERSGGEWNGMEIEGSSNPDEPTPEISKDNQPLSFLLADLIERNGSKRPNVTQRWADDERRLIDRDGRDRAEAERLVRWCQNDDFWRANILSMPKFRKQYDRLRLAALREAGGSVNPPSPESIEEFNA
jgi:hypothetical protein